MGEQRRGAKEATPQAPRTANRRESAGVVSPTTFSALLPPSPAGGDEQHKHQRRGRGEHARRHQLQEVATKQRGDEGVEGVEKMTSWEWRAVRF